MLLLSAWLSPYLVTPLGPLDFVVDFVVDGFTTVVAFVAAVFFCPSAWYFAAAACAAVVLFDVLVVDVPLLLTAAVFFCPSACALFAAACACCLVVVLEVLELVVLAAFVAAFAGKKPNLFHRTYGAPDAFR